MAATPDPFSGVGVPSWAGIEAAVNKQFPKVFSSELTYDGGGYHATGNAVDISNGGDNGTPQMDDLAGWIAANFGADSLEIIHVNQDGSTVEWKMGVKEPAGWYGQGTLAQHHNHVHWAITNAGLTAAGQPSNVLGATKSAGSGASSATASVGSGIIASILKPVIEFSIQTGLVLGGGVLLLFGLTLVIKGTANG